MKRHFISLVFPLVAWTLAEDPSGPRLGEDQGLALVQAYGTRDPGPCREVWDRVLKTFGERAGNPEEPDVYLKAPPGIKPLSQTERDKAFAPLARLVERHTWWKMGMDPATSEHALREVADVIRGYLAARRAGVEGGDALLEKARGAGDFLKWAQGQGGRGLFPFPAVRHGKSKAFLVAERFQKNAEATGKAVTVNGWLVEDMGRGDLQFDNGLCAVALLELYQATQDERYLKSGMAAVEWAMTQPVVANVNYNTFTTFALAKAWEVTGEPRFLAEAKLRTRMAVLPSQVSVGDHAGRWADGHNAKPVYHYIILRSLISVLGGMKADDPDRADVRKALRAGLLARNRDFNGPGIPNKSSAMEALLMAKHSRGISPAELEGCGVDEALGALERLVVGEVRSGKAPVGPLEWGLYLEYLASKRP